MPTTKDIQPIHGSSNIAGAGYDADERTLQIKFKSQGGSGRTYTYRNVGQDVYDGLMEASSAGEYFNANIKNIYPYS